MKEIPLKAKVQCTDLPCGQSTNLIIDPDSLQVTHVVIKDKTLPDNPTRLVPIDKVADALHDKISLNCTRGEVANMDPFNAAKDSSHDAVQVGSIPSGEMAVNPGMKINATDGTVGKLDEFLLDRRSGAITHLLMLKGHLWGKKDVVIPVENVDHTDGETIYLSINKEAVQALPAVSANRS